MNKTLFIFFLVFSLDIFALTPVRIDAEGQVTSFDLRGRPGFDGQNGRDAHLIDCKESVVIPGRNGEDGQDGEKGENGRDALVFFERFSSLKAIELNQSGGQGGNPGFGGRGAIGCNGGEPGSLGSNGVHGKDGKLGNIYLIDKKIDFREESTSLLLTLGELALQDKGFTKHYWDKHVGAKGLFKNTSLISNTFYEYKYTTNYNLKLLWNSSLSFVKYEKTRISLSLVNGELDLKSYRGPILDYKIKKIGNTFFLEVFDANSEHELKNLSFGKIRGAGEELTLEIKEKFKPIFHVETKFILSLYSENEAFRQDDFIGQFQIPQNLVKKVKDKFIILIGKLNFPPEFKRRGKKIKTHFSIYRKARMQTRVLALKGVFRI